MGLPSPSSPVLRVRCAVCDRPVERIRAYRMGYAFRWKIVVRCHGAVDEMELSDFEVAKMEEEGVAQIYAQEGVAFREGHVKKIAT